MEHTINSAAEIVARDVLAIKKDEQFLIITNPNTDVLAVSQALYKAAQDLGAESTIIIQDEKNQLNFANKATIASLGANPQVCASVSHNKMGKDKAAIENPFVHEGVEYDSSFHYQREGLKTMRAIWTPGITVDMFVRTAPIDYALLKRRCKAICSILENAETVHITAPAGTDIMVPIKGRTPMSDDGDFTFGGAGGNIPAGEVFISPLPGKSEGTIVFDGSISLNEGDVLVKEPVRVVYKDGFITEITGGKEAELLQASIKDGQERAAEFEKNGTFTAEEAKNRAQNCLGLGELGIGLNPAAEIRGNMLEDEKAFKTCHFAIGSNYDRDAEAMIHLDCVVKNPTIKVIYADGSHAFIEKDGELVPEIREA